jgi:type II secretory pathway pseudopilin PulG
MRKKLRAWGQTMQLHKWPRQCLGGTLLEVLVSLVIITMVAASVVEVSFHRRKTIIVASRTRAALGLAASWQAQRLQNAPWTRANAGAFPGRDDFRWTLVPLVPSSAEGTVPDEGWRQLRISPAGSMTDLPATFVVRLDRLPAQIAGGS